MARRHNELASGPGECQPCRSSRDGKEAGDVTCDSEPLGLPGRRTIFDTTVVAVQAPARLTTVAKALGADHGAAMGMGGREGGCEASGGRSGCGRAGEEVEAVHLTT